MDQTPSHISLSEEMKNTSLQPNPHPSDPRINTHFALAITAVCTSCLTGFLSIPLALAALIFSLRAQDQLTQNQLAEARQAAFWAAVFGWITIGLLLLPILVAILFGGAILAALGVAAAA